MIDSIASQLKINIANAAQHGESFVLATKAEANLLLDRNENAALYYEQVVERPDFAPHHASAMFKQIQRIFRSKPPTKTKFDEAKFKSILKQ